MSKVHFDQVQTMITAIESETPSSVEELEQFRLRYLGAKNLIKPLFSAMKDVGNDEKKPFGLLLNEPKSKA